MGDHEELDRFHGDGTPGEKTVVMSTSTSLHRGWHRAVLLAVVSALGTGCITSNEAPTDDLGGIVMRTGGNGGVGEGIWINNGLSDPDVSGVDPAHSLSSPQGMSETEGILANEDTRVVAQYLVECALPNGKSIVKEVDGAQIVLQGRVGLAPEWRNGSCNQSCQEWVSACLLARTNPSPQSVSISLRADHPALGFEGHPDYPIYEGSYFGNLFADTEGRYLCRGSADAATIAQEVGRACSGDPASCGFEAYDDCEEEERCEFEDHDGDLVAIDCTPEGSNVEHETISVYVMDPY